MGYGLKIEPLATHDDIERVPYQIAAPREGKLKVTIEGCWPNCYVCGVLGHMKEEFSKYQSPRDKEHVAQGQNTIETRILTDTDPESNNCILEATEKPVKIVEEWTSDTKKVQIEEKISEKSNEFIKPKRCWRKKASSNEEKPSRASELEKSKRQKQNKNISTASPGSPIKNTENTTGQRIAQRIYEQMCWGREAYDEREV